MEEVDDMKLTSCSFQNPELKFGYGIPKGSWDFEVDFVGTIDGDEIEGVYYPTQFLMAPLRADELLRVLKR